MVSTIATLLLLLLFPGGGIEIEGMQILLRRRGKRVAGNDTEQGWKGDEGLRVMVVEGKSWFRG